MSDRVAVVAEIVADVLGEHPSSVEHIPTLEDSNVFRVQAPSGRCFFKSEHEGHPIAIAAWAYEKAGSLGLPVPEVLHLDLTRERWPDEFMVVTALSGTDLEHDPLQGRALADSIEGYGELLRRLHGAPLDGFGDLDFRDPAASEPAGEFGDHASSVRVDWGLPYLCDRGLITADVADRIQEVMDRHAELIVAPEQGMFIHGDPGLDHLFVDRTNMRITGLIDFEPEAADPAADLAIFAYHFPNLVVHLLNGYGDTPDDLPLRLDLYGLMRAVGSVRWVHERLPDVSPDIEDLVERSARMHALLS